MQQAFTHHFIDGLPEWDDLQPWDQALDKFRALYPLPAVKAIVAEDGKSMYYDLTGSRIVENYIKMARLVIQTSMLPLVVSRDRQAIAGVALHDHMVVTYVQQ